MGKRFSSSFRHLCLPPSYLTRGHICKNVLLRADPLIRFSFAPCLVTSLLTDGLSKGSEVAMLFVTFALLLGIVALLWHFILALTLANGDSTEGQNCTGLAS